jgi:hypothetical protein
VEPTQSKFQVKMFKIDFFFTFSYPRISITGAYLHVGVNLTFNLEEYSGIYRALPFSYSVFSSYFSVLPSTWPSKYDNAILPLAILTDPVKKYEEVEKWKYCRIFCMEY